jgi:outer membrane lipoprotein-sorting protein
MKKERTEEKNRRVEFADITVWIDAKTLLPLKRTVVMKLGEQLEGWVPKDARISETYTEFNLNPKIDAKTFEMQK